MLLIDLITVAETAQGLLLSKKIQLFWSCLSKYQGGETSV
ncbi:hypothetical protein BVRB_9g221580 isoform A [Beta vulgaris subsp. vulgaris]|nr:hypothetical protein BVRB_9g221580 isoform A [Beta vulgaris subsp. vulgaris]